MARSFVIGIAGGSGSGKSTLVERIMSSEHAPYISLLPHDSYYFDAAQMPEEIQRTENRDHPDSLDNRLFLSHIDQLLNGHAIEQPIYDFSTHSRSSKSKRIEPRPVLLLEGILLLAIPDLPKRMDLRIFVDTPPEERIVRRMLRDIVERGRTVQSVAEQFRSTVRQMHDQFVEPSRANAHVIIPWDWAGDHEPAVAVLLAQIGQAIAVHSR